MKPITIIEKARSYLGTTEGDNKHAHLIKIYNNDKPLPRGYKAKLKDKWCAIFVTAIGIESDAQEVILKECSCQLMLYKYVKKKLFFINGYIPKTGDLVFYDWNCDGISEHVGIVEYVRDGIITTIEGNKGNRVSRRDMSFADSRILGFAHPDYENSTITKDENLVYIANEVLLGKWGNYPERKERLEKAGYNYEEIQKIVNSLL